MAWKARGGRLYYYQSERVDGRSVSTYVGPLDGGIARMVAVLDRRRREDAEGARRALRAEAGRMGAHDRAADALAREAKAVIDAALVAAGYHRHAGGHWRKRRMDTTAGGKTIINVPHAAATVELMKGVGRLEAILAERMMTWPEAKEGDRQDRTRESIRDEVHRLTEDLAGGPNAPPILRLAAHVAAVAYYDWILTRFVAQRPDPPKHQAQAIERAEKRFHRAAKGLHDLQRRLPDVLVAIGRVDLSIAPRAAMQGQEAPTT